MEKSANKRWKESGTTLSFKEWIGRENGKSESDGSSFLPFDGDSSFSIPAPELSSTIEDTINVAKADMKAGSGYKSVENKNNLLGLDKRVLIFSTLLIVGSLGFYAYSKMKKNAK